jgi:sorbitol-specific phosphotransferase system component IIA
VSEVVHALPSSQGSVLFAKTQPTAGLQLSVVHGLSSPHTRGAPGWQVPLTHASFTVQASESVQGPVLFVCSHPTAASQLSVVHGLPSLQSRTPAPGRQTPSPQVSPRVHASPSLHGAVLFVWTQPVLGSHESSVQTLPSPQSRTPKPGWQTPSPHVSDVVHALPSSHGSVLFAKTQPRAGSQLSVVHGLSSPHTRGAPGWQVPLTHASFTVQAFESVQGPVLFVCSQPTAASQLSVVHALPSLQSRTPAPDRQMPSPQMSPTVQELPSLHAAVLLVWTQPDFVSHESSVQMLPSSQARAAPPAHSPSTHASAVVHASPSSQGSVLFE